MTAPRVAVVIPAFRRETRLAFALAALAEQTLNPREFEVLVVRAPGEEGPFAAAPDGLRVRFLVAPVRGPAAQRNHGWRAAAARMVAFTDDDCRPAPHWLEALLAAATGADADAVVQGRTEPDPDEAHLLTGLARSMRVEALDPWHPACNIAYPRALLDRLGGFDEAFPASWAEDTELALRATAVGARHLYAPEALVWHAVLPRALPQALRDAGRRQWVPALVARHPGHRRALFCRWFVNESHAALALGLFGLVAGGRRRAAVALLPYLALQVPRDADRRIVRPRRLVRLALAVLERLAVDLVEVGSALRGAAESRALVV